TLKPIFVNWAIPPNVISDAGAGHEKNGAVTSSVCPAKNAGILQQRTLSTTLLRRFQRVWLGSYRVKFPDIAEITEEHPPKRQQQAAAAKAPEITPFTS
ncbi:hypothetical protein, partial [Klebsiella pneumoniae]|uniref:hypothetical protein n=1 Tax=Klebsiella pneumoniae TaxID=573 RepID=UPI001EE83CC6